MTRPAKRGDSRTGGYALRRAGDRKRQGLSGPFARVGMWLTAFALLSQSLVVAARELTALLGPGVVVCTQIDGAGAPAHVPDCHDQCPLGGKR